MNLVPARASNFAKQVQDLGAKVKRVGYITPFGLNPGHQLSLVGKQFLAGTDQLLEVGLFHA